MKLDQVPIRRKLMTVVMLTSLAALGLSVLSFLTYDLITFREHLVQGISTVARIAADNSSAAIVFGNEKEAEEILTSLHAEPQINTAALFDAQGKLFVSYPRESAVTNFIPPSGSSGHFFSRGQLILYEPVTRQNTRLGTILITADLSLFYQRLEIYAAMSALILLGSLGVALALSQRMQKTISDPIIALAETARVISERRDYSVRALKISGDELGVLTDAFNEMLARIEQQTSTSAFLAAIVTSSDDAIIGKDLDGNVVSWNTGAEKMFGFSAPEMIGQSVTRILGEPDEETRILAEAKRGEIRNYETIRIRKDGKQLNVSLTVSPIRDPNGRIVGVSSIIRDITERIRAREALERSARVLREQAQLLDLANVMVRDLDDHIILWNTGMERMYGWLRSEAIGHLFHELLNSEFPEPLEKIKAVLLRDGRWEGELVHTRKDGNRIAVSSQWVLHTDEQGQPAAILEVNVDITERKLAEERLQELNINLEHLIQERTAELTTANRELEAFTYSVAHDLRAPLRHIDAFTKILQEDFSDRIPPEASSYLNTIRRGSESMSQLVNDLLNLARVSRQELRREHISLNTLVNQVRSELAHETAKRNIEWHIEPLPEINGDPGLIKQVFANLISNAIKYSRPRERAVIDVGVRSQNGQTAVYVKDNGVGFNMKYADKLFGVFQRLHRAEEFEGTGVGLAIVERVIHRHGGRIWAESELNKGATFYFTLDGLPRNGATSRPAPNETVAKKRPGA